MATLVPVDVRTPAANPPHSQRPVTEIPALEVPATRDWTNAATETLVLADAAMTALRRDVTEILALADAAMIA